MPAPLLYHMPSSCSRVAPNAPEEIGVPYRESGIALIRGVQRKADFLAINAKGKVPVPASNGRVIPELPAILYYLAGDDARPYRWFGRICEFVGDKQPSV